MHRFDRRTVAHYQGDIMGIPEVITTAVVTFVLSAWVLGVAKELGFAFDTVSRARSRRVYGLLMGITYLACLICVGVPFWLIAFDLAMGLPYQIKLLLLIGGAYISWETLHSFSHRLWRHSKITSTRPYRLRN